MVDPTGIRYQKNTRMLNLAPKNVRGGSQNHLKSYLQVPKTVTREEAYKGGQKQQIYTAYFPNDLQGTIDTIRAVDAMLCQKQ